MTGSTNDDFDSGNLLRGLRPHRGDEYLAPGADPRAEALLDRIVSQELDGKGSARYARRVALLVIGATVVCASAAAALILTRRPGDPTVLSCYSSSDVEQALQFAIPPDAQRTAIEQCAELWSDGRISTNGPPGLVACVTDADIVAVLPGDEAACAAAGWVLAATSTGPGIDRTSDLTNTLSDRFADQCVNPDAAIATVEQVLDELGLVEWRIDDRTTDPESCTAPIVDVPSRSIDVVSLPR